MYLFVTVNSTLRRLLSYFERLLIQKFITLQEDSPLVLMSKSFILITSLDLSQLRSTIFYEPQVMNKLGWDNRLTDRPYDKTKVFLIYWLRTTNHGRQELMHKTIGLTCEIYYSSMHSNLVFSSWVDSSFGFTGGLRHFHQHVSMLL